MNFFLETLKNEWGVIKDAPFSIITLILGAFALGYLFSNLLKKSVVESLNERLKLAQDKNHSYEEKLNVASPAQAEERMASLEEQLIELSKRFEKDIPLRLTNDQKKTMIEVLSVGSGQKVSIAKDGSAPGISGYAADLAEVFTRGGWEVSVPMVLGISRPPTTGTSVSLPRASERSKHQKAVLSAFEAASLKYDLRDNNSGALNRDFDVEITVTVPAVDLKQL